MDPYQSPEADPKPGASEDQAEAVTATLPRSLFGDSKVAKGDTISLRIENAYDEEVEVSLVAGGEGGDESDRSQMPANEELDAMAQE